MLGEASVQRARALLRSAIVWDNHGCMPLRADATFLPQLERYRQSGVNLVSLNVGDSNVPLFEHLRVLSIMRQWLATHSDSYRLVATVADIKRCKEEGKLGIVFDVEGMFPVQDDPSFVQTLYELGVRWMLIAYNHNNKAGGGCLDVDTGLTVIGRTIIDEMQRVGRRLMPESRGAHALPPKHWTTSAARPFSHTLIHPLFGPILATCPMSCCALAPGKVASLA